MARGKPLEGGFAPVIGWVSVRRRGAETRQGTVPGKQDKDRGGESNARRARVAEQLRRNLQRRKAQSRGRAAEDAAGDESAPTGGENDAGAGRK